MKPDDLLAITFLQKYPIDSARLLESMNSREIVEFLVTLPSEIVARVLQHALPQTSLALLESMPEKTVVDIVSYMSTTSAISMLSQGEPSWQVGILGKLDTKLHAATLKAFSFPEQSAGRFADPRVLLFTAVEPFPMQSFGSRNSRVANMMTCSSWIASISSLEKYL